MLFVSAAGQALHAAHKPDTLETIRLNPHADKPYHNTTAFFL
jgi:hypothetical protein